MGRGPYWYAIHFLTLSDYAIFSINLYFVTNKIIHILLADEEGAITVHSLLCDDLKFDLPGGRKIVVQWDELGRPVGNGAGVLGVFLGVLASSATKLPITYERWPKVASIHKNQVWATIKV